MRKIEKFCDSKGNLMAIVIPNDYVNEGIEFVTGDDEYQQIAVMNHKSGHSIIPHFHNKIPRTIDYTSETLVIRKGILNVKLDEDKVEKYSDKKQEKEPC